MMTFDPQIILSIIQRLRDRDEDALVELYDLHGRRVYSLAFAILNDVMLAEEVTQDAFLRVWEQIARYRYEENRFLGWLLKIAHNMALNRLAQEKRVNHASHSFDDDDFIEPPDFVFEDENRWRELELMMQSLPAEQREVIVLAEYHSMSQSEMAEYLKLPLGTVKTRQRLGMEKLRTIWQKTQI